MTFKCYFGHAHESPVDARTCESRFLVFYPEVEARTPEPDPDAVDIEIEPHGINSPIEALDTMNLYLRPGRFIPVNGPINDEGE